MRLSPKEINAIRSAATEVLTSIPHKLFLYGSRTDDKKRGGDIDLLISVPSETEKEKVVPRKTQIRMKIFDFIPEQKIDITVATHQELESDPFFQSLTKIAL